MLYGECTVKDGAVEQTNFDTYNVMRMREMPKVEVIVMPSEVSVAASASRRSRRAPAVLNAIFAATGKRLRSVPIKHQGIRTA